VANAAGIDLAGGEKRVPGEPRIVDDAQGAGGRNAIVVAHTLTLRQAEEYRQH